MFTKEDYVSLEVAKLLKEKGFECVTGWAYNLSSDNLELHHESNVRLPKHIISAPTLYEAQKWLRDKHNIDIIVEPEIDENTDKKIGYCFDLYTDSPSVTYSLLYTTYEEALNAGILESLKLLDYKIYTEIHVWDRGNNYMGNIIFDKKHGIPFMSDEEFEDLILEHFPQLKGKGWITKFV